MIPRLPPAPDAPAPLAAAAMIAGLWGLGVVQPLLDLLGRNPAFFVAADARRWAIVTFALVVTFAVPVAVWALFVAAHRFAPRTYRYLVGGLVAAGIVLVATAFGRSMFPNRTLAHVAVALVIVAIAVVAAWTSSGFRSFLQTLAITLPVFLGLFLFASTSGELLRAGEVGLEQDVEIARPDDVVMVILDELPLSTLLDAEGQLNEERYPGFASLAERSTFFDNAIADHARTSDSVPSIVSGVVPETTVAPIASEYPRNLFTLLGSEYDMTVSEELTRLCPVDECRTDQPSYAAVMGALLDDSGVVLEHLLLPPRLRSGLPAIDQGWGDFDLAATAELGGTVSAGDPLLEWQDRQNVAVSRTTERTEAVESVVAAAARPADPDPELFFVHTVLPHAPWERAPDGTLFTTSADHDIPIDQAGRWIDSETDVIHSFQRHVLQVGHVDRMIGELVEALDDSGRWDDTLVIVTADHGGSFAPGVSRRVPDDQNSDDIFRVPLFVHAPGGPTPGTEHDLVRNIDVMPTVIDALGVDVDWELPGISLLADSHHDVSGPVESRSGNQTVRVPPTNEGALATARRTGAWFPNGDGWTGLAAPGEAGELVGRRLDASEPIPTTGAASSDVDPSMVDRSTGYAPIVFPVNVERVGSRPERLLIVVDDVVAGVGLPTGRDETLYRAVLDPAILTDGHHEIRVLTWTDGVTGELELRSDARMVRGEDGWIVDGEPLPEQPPSDTRLGYVERVITDGPIVAVWGWAADLDERSNPGFVALVDGDKVLSIDSALTARSDIGNAHGDDVADAAFAMRGPVTDDPVVVAVFDDSTMTIPLDRAP